jgi:hypothetical protein
MNLIPFASDAPFERANHPISSYSVLAMGAISALIVVSTAPAFAKTTKARDGEYFDGNAAIKADDQTKKALHCRMSARSETALTASAPRTPGLSN